MNAAGWALPQLGAHCAASSSTRSWSAVSTWVSSKMLGLQRERIGSAEEGLVALGCPSVMGPSLAPAPQRS